MDPWVATLILKPFILLAFMIIFVVLPKYLFMHYFPEGRIKRLLLTRLS